MFGEDDMYLQSFKRYVSHAECVMIDKVIEGKLPLGNEDFQDFSVFDCKKIVIFGLLTETLIELAHKELVQKPSYVVDCWVKILSPLKLHFPTRRVGKSYVLPATNTSKDMWHV